MKVKVLRKVLSLVTAAAVLLAPCQGEAGLLFHATKRAIAKKIAAKGFSAAAMSGKARFGKGVYLSKSMKTALKERHADTVAVFRDTGALKKKTVDTRRASMSFLKRLSGDTDLRGNIHKGVIGPDLGHNIAKNAAKAGNVVAYKSAKDGRGTNLIIPDSVYARKPGMVTFERLIENGR